MTDMPETDSARRNEAMADLRVFLEEAEAEGELVEVPGASVDEEIGALFELSNEHLYPPVLMFKDIPGFDPAFRILSNVRTVSDRYPGYCRKSRDKTGNTQKAVESRGHGVCRKRSRGGKGG